MCEEETFPTIPECMSKGGRSLGRVEGKGSLGERKVFVAHRACLLKDIVI